MSVMQMSMQRHVIQREVVAMSVGLLRLTVLVANHLRTKNERVSFQEQNKLSLQVAVLVLAGMSKFTLWGAVLVDVGTALLVILHGMMLMRWRLPQAMRPGSSQNVQCSQQRWTPSADRVETHNSPSDNQPCSSSSDSYGTSAVTVGQGTVMLPLGGKAESCSADRQCCTKVAAMKPEAGSAAGSAAGIPKCCDSGKLCKPQIAAPRHCKGSASDTLASGPSCRNSRRQCQPQDVAVKLREDTGTGAPGGKPSCCSSKRQCQVKAAAVQQEEGSAPDAPAARPSCCSSVKT